MQAKKQKPFFEMTAAEKSAFVQKLERGIPRARLRPLSAKENVLWQAARRAPGRPRKPAGEKAVPVRVTFEPSLLTAIDACARQRGISRAQLLAEGAKLALAGKKRSA